MSTSKRKVSVAEYIEQQIAFSEKSQKDIAEEIGYDKPNVLTMIKQGKTKLPVNKVGQLAMALGVDPVHLLRLVMSEYMPQTWEAIENVVGTSLVSRGERKLIESLRDQLGGIGIEDISDRSRELLLKTVKEIAAYELKDRDSAVAATTPLRVARAKARVGK
jgi:DNA-binding CsgD family transcriptional regulator